VNDGGPQQSADRFVFPTVVQQILISKYEKQKQKTINVYPSGATRAFERKIRVVSVRLNTGTFRPADADTVFEPKRALHRFDQDGYGRKYLNQMQNDFSSDGLVPVYVADDFDVGHAQQVRSSGQLDDPQFTIYRHTHKSNVYPLCVYTIARVLRFFDAKHT